MYVGGLCVRITTVNPTSSQVVVTKLDTKPAAHCNEVSLFIMYDWALEHFYPRDVYVNAVLATATWLAGWLDVCQTPALYQNG